jgi:hypothetical protein
MQYARSNGSTWSAAEDAALEQMWRSGLSTTRIGAALGKTKNAVIGRAHRLRLPLRGSPVKRRDGATASKSSRPRKAAAAVLRAVKASRSVWRGDVSPMRHARIDLLPESVAALRIPARPKIWASTCQWPLWPNGARRDHPDYGRYCGATSAYVSYCAVHAARAYVGLHAEAVS